MGSQVCDKNFGFCSEKDEKSLECLPKVGMLTPQNS